MNKSSIILTVIIIAGIIGAFYLNLDKIESTINIGNPALEMTISTDVNESDVPIITNIDFKQTEVIYKGSDAPTILPEISIMIRNDAVNSAPVSYWASQTWVEGENKTYTFTVLFRESYTPKKGDRLIIQIRFTDFSGSRIEKKTALYEWK
jgi:uncharacterized protein (UPF0333 family)